MSEETEELNRVMLVGAHPDDPEFGCGGTMAKWAAEGKEITYVIMTNGDKGTHDPNVRLGDLAETREAEQRAAANVLGVRNVIFLGYPDQMLENTMAIRRELTGIVRQVKPHIMVAIDPWREYQLHPDHRAAGFVALDTIYAAREVHIFPEQFMGDVSHWRIKEAYLYWTSNADYFEELEDYVDVRIEAIKQHVSQVRDPDGIGERIRKRMADTAENTEFNYTEGLKQIKFY